MTHRIVAALICCVTVLASIKVLKRSRVKSASGILAIGWLALILVQAGLGAATVWTNKAADIATLHLLVGAMSFACGVVLCLFLSPSLDIIGNLTKPVQQSCASPLGNRSIAREAM